MSGGAGGGKRRGSPLSHVDRDGRARMVDVGDKSPSSRRAVARATLRLPPEAFAAVRDATLEKGDALAIARLAGIMAAKETHRLLPLCHPLPISHVTVDFDLEHGEERVVITASVRAEARTGVEMEALTAASVAALALYDTAKSVSKGIEIESVVLLEKEGGKSGRWSSQRR